MGVGESHVGSNVGAEHGGRPNREGRKINATALLVFPEENPFSAEGIGHENALGVGASREAGPPLMMLRRYRGCHRDGCLAAECPRKYIPVSVSSESTLLFFFGISRTPPPG